MSLKKTTALLLAIIFLLIGSASVIEASNSNSTYSPTAKELKEKAEKSYARSMEILDFKITKQEKSKRYNSYLKKHYEVTLTTFEIKVRFLNNLFTNVNEKILGYDVINPTYTQDEILVWTGTANSRIEDNGKFSHTIEQHPIWASFGFPRKYYPEKIVVYQSRKYYQLLAKDELEQIKKSKN